MIVQFRDETGAVEPGQAPIKGDVRAQPTISAALELLGAVLSAWMLARQQTAPAEQAERALARLEAARDSVPWGGWFSEAAFAACAHAPRVGLMVLLMILAWL